MFGKKSSFILAAAFAASTMIAPVMAQNQFLPTTVNPPATVTPAAGGQVIFLPLAPQAQPAPPPAASIATCPAPPAGMQITCTPVQGTQQACCNTQTSTASVVWWSTMWTPLIILTLLGILGYWLTHRRAAAPVNQMVGQANVVWQPPTVTVSAVPFVVGGPQPVFPGAPAPVRPVGAPRPAPAAGNCRHCGQPHPAASIFCPTCGGQLMP